jgi:hypothetical protein
VVVDVAVPEIATRHHPFPTLVADEAVTVALAFVISPVERFTYIDGKVVKAFPLDVGCSATNAKVLSAAFK